MKSFLFLTAVLLIAILLCRGTLAADEEDLRLDQQHAYLLYEHAHQEEHGLEDTNWWLRAWNKFDGIPFERWVLTGSAAMGIVGASLFIAFSVFD